MRPLNLLIVDDNPADVELMCDAFNELGTVLNITVAAGGGEAMAMLKEAAVSPAQRPAGILLDLNMPGIDGRQVLTYVKSTPRLSGIPTIILTSSSSPKDRSDCLGIGADAYITKPGTLSELNELTRHVYAFLSKGPEQQQFSSKPPDSPLLGVICAGIRRMFRMRAPVLGW